MFFDRWTIGRRLYVGCGALLALTILAGVVAIAGTSRIKGDVDTVIDRASVLQRALTIQTALFKIEGREKTMLWAGLDSNTALYRQSKATLATDYEQAAREVEALAALVDSAADRTVSKVLSDNLNESHSIHDQVVQLADAARFSDAQQQINDKVTPVLRAAEDAAAGLIRRHQETMMQARAEAVVSYQFARLIIGLVAVAALVFSIGGVWIVRGVNASLDTVSHELRDGAQLVVDASSQMAVSAQSVSQGASQQAASLEETSASMEEMAVMTRRNADNSHQAATVVADAATVVQTANGSLVDMVSSMTSIRDSSNRVSKIIKTIDEIAFQTNILALNAAVEAARAGEAGMGFAVVADEVRSLAQRSAQAAKDTAGLIEEAITSANEGSRKVEQVAQAFNAITSNVTQIKSLVDEVSTASKQQALGIDQVTQAIRQMERVTQTSAATAEESAAACQQLNAQADVTMGVVRRLEIMVGGDRGGNARGHENRRRIVHSNDLVNRGDAQLLGSRSSRQNVPVVADAGTFGTF
jgi:methyl-accepting chemotaxis protein/methyl-accepting chemotaxis protein-1 (serine sensor receptor)